MNHSLKRALALGGLGLPGGGLLGGDALLFLLLGALFRLFGGLLLGGLLGLSLIHI